MIGPAVRHIDLNAGSAQALEAIANQVMAQRGKIDGGLVVQSKTR
jgi:hypothetical protein